MRTPLLCIALSVLVSTHTVFADDNEANPFDVDFSFDEVPIGMTNNNMKDDDVDRQVGCVKGTDASFIRTRQAFFNGTPNTIAMVEMVTCADFCRDNVDPVSGEKSDCIGFNYYNTRSPSCAYFSKSVQKKCLSVGNTCKHAAFAFDVLPNKILDVHPFRELIVSNVDQCLNACLDDPRCLSLNYIHADRHCQINEVSHRKSGQLKENHGSTYYENNCIHEKDRCGNKRIEFVMSKHSEIRGKDISVGVRDIRNCMRECIESPLIFCRSFEFDSTTNECFISEDDSQSVISSENLNLYEPICVDRTLELRCSLPYLFEKFQNKRLVSVEPLAESHNFSLEQCIEHCLYERNCRSLNYGHDRICRLLPMGSDDHSRKIIDDDENDFYELSCKLATLPESEKEEAMQPPPVSAAFRAGILIANTSLEECTWEEVDRARTVHRPYRKEHLIDIKQMDSCQDACSHADFKCVTFAFSEQLKECVLSETVLDKESPDYKAIIQYNQMFVLFKRKCRSSSIAEEIQPYAGFVDGNMNDLSTVTIATEDFSDAITFESADSHFDILSTMIVSSGSPEELYTKSNLLEGEMTKSMLNESSTLESDGTSLQIVTNEMSTTSDANIIEQNKGGTDEHVDVQPFESGFDEDTSTSNPSTADSFTEALSRASWLAEMEQSAGQIPTIGPESGHIPPEKVNVTAICSENGVNVTFTTRGNKYTGSVYAAERFSQCRIFIHEESNFSIFISRPTINNSCNAIEINETLAVVVVMSNDRVTPLDVTTKDDLFYEIKCKYARFVEDSEPTSIRSGLVVGGPNPRSVLSSFERPTMQKANIVLKITKDGRVVDNVFIGEKLTAVVESDIEPDHLKVIDCNASRIGGVEPQPNSITLISQGCAMMPQIMGHVEMASQRLEAPLTAFRIDGSDQIEIACSVLVCKDKCPQKRDNCERNRKRRSNDDNDNDAVTIDRRLRVYVDSDRVGGYAMRNNDLCVSLWIYLCTVAFFGILLTITIAFLCTNWKRQKRDLHMEPLGTSDYCPRSQYYKTIDSLPKLERTLATVHCDAS